MIQHKDKSEEITEDWTTDGFQTKTAEIDEEGYLQLFDMVSNNMYKNPIGSIVREITSNCFDSHIEAGVDDPVIILFDKDEDGAFISFKDVGVGLSPDRVEKIYMKYFNSTKRNTNEQIGAFGLGSKSPFSYTDSFFIKTIFEKRVYSYIFYKSNGKPTLDLLFDDSTEERNGTEIKIYFKTNKISEDILKFLGEVKKQLSYFDSVYVIDNLKGYTGYRVVDNDYKIYEGKNFKLRNKDLFSPQMHIIFGKVPYSIDWDELELAPINIPVGLTFDIGDLKVTPSRESLRYDDDIKAIVKAKILAAKDEILQVFKENYTPETDFKNWLKFRKDINTCVTFKRGETYFSIDINSIINKQDFPRVLDFEVEHNIQIPNDPFYFYTVSHRLKKGKSFIQDHYGANNIITQEGNKSYLTDNFVPNKTKINYITSRHSTAYIVRENNRLTYRHHRELLGISKTALGTAKKIYEYKKYIRKIVKTYVNLYDNVVVPQDWIEENSTKLGADYLKELRKVNQTIPCYDLINRCKSELKIADGYFIKGLIFYYFKEDSEEAEVFRDLILRTKIIGGKQNKTGNKIHKTDIKLLRVSQANQKFLKNKPKMRYLQDFLTQDNKYIRRLATYLYINRIDDTKFNSRLTGGSTYSRAKVHQLLEPVSASICKDLRDIIGFIEDNGNLSLTSNEKFVDAILYLANKHGLWDLTYKPIFDRIEEYFKGSELFFYAEVDKDRINLLVDILKLRKKRVNFWWYQTPPIVAESVEEAAMLCESNTNNDEYTNQEVLQFLTI